MLTELCLLLTYEQIQSEEVCALLNLSERRVKKAYEEEVPASCSEALRKKLNQTTCSNHVAEIRSEYSWRSDNLENLFIRCVGYYCRKPAPVPPVPSHALAA